MTDFNSMTLMAAGEVIAEMSTQTAFSALTLSWDVEDFCNSGSVASRANDLVRFAKSRMGQQRHVPTARGLCDLPRAMIEHAITASEKVKLDRSDAWSRLVAGLKMDGFEVGEDKLPDPSGRKSIFENGPIMIAMPTLKRMLPQSAPGLDFREADNEVVGILRKHAFKNALGHIEQAMSAFHRGEWAGANAQLRTFTESYLSQLATRLGYIGENKMNERFKFLGELNPPFLLSAYNEWHSNESKAQFAKGLWIRMHPEGSHPGLSEEEDATFRLQITLVTARLYLRRFDKRISQK
ncbi:hypothetical protein [Paracoccus sp. (in: a-proteobacteria)]|uniref:hypothetical protein n=1 Tax=Paracoccus sp. TaxID=267 RepID=UPI00289BDA71|nr:hypothetical protein [Paracoccus sp. (in: a-proteobacteria)]